MNKELFSYIKKSIDSGYTDDAIIQALVNHGMTKTHAGEALKFVLKNRPRKKEGPDFAKPIARAAAFGWDSIIIWLPTAFIAWLIYTLSKKIYTVPIILFLASCVVIYFEAKKGGTPGKLMTGIRVTTYRQEAIGYWVAIKRYLLKVLSVLPLGIGFAVLFWDKKYQTFYDKKIKTYVIEIEEKPDQINVGKIILIVEFVILSAILLITAVIFILDWMSK